MEASVSVCYCVHTRIQTSLCLTIDGLLSVIMWAVLVCDISDYHFSVTVVVIKCIFNSWLASWYRFWGWECNLTSERIGVVFEDMTLEVLRVSACPVCWMKLNCSVKVLGSWRLLLLWGLPELSFIQAEDVMDKLILLRRLDHPTSEHTTTVNVLHPKNSMYQCFCA